MTPMLTPLDRSQLRAAGVTEPWSYGIADMVRFYELDALNHVNNVAYLRWFETVRVRYMIDYGVSDFSHGADTPQLVVRAATAEYLKPMFQNERYVVTARTAQMRSASFTMEYAVFAGDLRATGTAVVVMMTPDGGAKMPLPQQVRDTFVRRDHARQIT
ncbi:MAG: acyl-CoA thioesterase [Rhodobacteraceae bacterium]|nr:acyl-CoA thioesterase [Paracoccaceae bacterium]